MGLRGLVSWYQTPARVDLKRTLSLLAQNEAELEKAPSPRASLDIGERGGIPTRLSLERVLKNKTCSPMSLYDFYMYLTHIEYSPENLEFYLWFRDYSARWDRSPPVDEPKDSFSSSQATLTEKLGPTAVHVKEIDVEDEDQPSDHASYLADVERGPAEAIITRITGSTGCGRGPCVLPSEETRGTALTGLKSKFTSSGARKGSETTVQSVPADDASSVNSASTLLATYRAELNGIINEYLLPSSPKELNLPSGLRDKALAALRTSTAPEHLRPLAAHCYVLLKSCSHRNFVRLGVGNGTFETLCIATTLGIALTCAGFLYIALLAFASDPGHLRAASRWKGLGAFPLWWLGLSFIFSGLRGSCFFLLLLSRRQPLPWERFGDGATADATGTLAGSSWSVVRFMRKMMIFDRKMRVKDEVLRNLQRRIVVQSVAGGFILAVLLCVIWLSVPIWQ